MAQEDDFDAMFGAAAAEAEKTVQEKVNEPPPEEPAKVEEPKAEEPAVEEKPEAPPAGEGEEKTKTPEEVAAEATAAAEAKAAEEAATKKAAEEAAVREQAELRVRVEAEARVAAETRAKAEADKKAAEEKTAKELEASLQPYEMTAEEKAAEEVMKRDFPNEYAVLQARIKQLEQQFNAKVYKTEQGMVQIINGKITPISKTIEDLGAEAHVKAIHQAHSDFDTVVGLIPEWIKKQPSFKQKAYQQAYDEGSTQDVIDLVKDFKEATGRVQTTTPPPPTPKPQASAEEIAAGMPVSSKRSSPSGKGAADPNDYDGAFAEAAAGSK